MLTPPVAREIVPEFKSMKSNLRSTLAKIAISILAVVALGIIGIYPRLDSHFDEKLYPVLLLGSIILWHWIAWQLFFDLIALPISQRAKLNRAAIARTSPFRLLIPVGYTLLGMCFFNFYVSPEYAQAARGVGYSLMAIVLGLMSQMLTVVRYLISEKFKVNPPENYAC
jgi:hypothetical protein